MKLAILLCATSNLGVLCKHSHPSTNDYSLEPGAKNVFFLAKLNASFLFKEVYRRKRKISEHFKTGYKSGVYCSQWTPKTTNL